MKGNTYVFNDHIDCKTSNVVYGIRCDKCSQLLYVGETGNTVYVRFQNHLTAIRQDKNGHISNHFNDPSHKMEDLKIVGIEKIKINDTYLRKIRETFWIKKMETFKAPGCNSNLGSG